MHGGVGVRVAGEMTTAAEYASYWNAFLLIIKITSLCVLHHDEPNCDVTS